MTREFSTTVKKLFCDGAEWLKSNRYRLVIVFAESVFITLTCFLCNFDNKSLWTYFGIWLTVYVGLLLSKTDVDRLNDIPNQNDVHPNENDPNEKYPRADNNHR